MTSVMHKVWHRELVKVIVVILLSIYMGELAPMVHPGMDCIFRMAV